ncbi:MAG: glycoside hydrolase family 3 C-terminal domain-containing protein [Defluviitaleaceae bacterium]|nr:glycoside hydrolase family 3 C-terminal domain-containing protein [Defluviitaleaceae bacterium]MCL2262790.1 glycoside hydrolase family 3 C-terminal domain-containing protein [Defluviitaleaceae bacterium]
MVSQMTLEEKVSQMLHYAGEVERLNIPSYNWWSEALHGVARAGTATMFPQAIAMAATFDKELLKQVADVTATEGRAKYHAFSKEGDRDIYKGLSFWSPNINIFRDPRWGRGHETYGEDPYLTAELGVAFIEGIQGEDKNSLKAIACAKHFAVHSGPEADRHSFDAICDPYDLWNTYLPQFEAAVYAGVESVMGAYNRLLGEPCCGSQLLLVDILRGKWQFDGHVVSDCWAIEDFHKHHHVTDNPIDSVALAVQKGCDLCCGDVMVMAVEAVQSGKLAEADIDRSVERLLVSRMKLGLLGAKENKKYTSIPYEVVDCEEHNELNLEVTRRSPILLKNNGALPLDFKALKKIAVIGPNADSRRALEGNYNGTATRYVTVLDGIRQVAAKTGTQVLFSEGCHLFKEKTSVLAKENNRLSEAVIAAKESDAIVLVLGLDADIEGEEGDTGNEFASGDKIDINLVGRQQLLLEKVTEAAAGKPVILVMITGSAMAINYADEHCAGIIQAFYPGALGGQAIAEIICGKVNPSGKLPVTFYRSTNDLPEFWNYSMHNRTYRYYHGETLYPFGFGLSYTTFALDGLEVAADNKSVAVKIKNTGKKAGREVVQVYVSSPNQKEKYRLVGVAPISLAANKFKKITIELAADTYSRRDWKGDLYTLEGEHTLHVGICQPDSRSIALTGAEPLSAMVEV